MDGVLYQVMEAAVLGWQRVCVTRVIEDVLLGDGVVEGYDILGPTRSHIASLLHNKKIWLNIKQYLITVCSY